MRRVGVIVAIMGASLVVALCVVSLFARGQAYDCRESDYAEELNGGVKYFQNRKYAVSICGGGVSNGFFGDGMEAVELTITSEQGELLARKRYKVFWGGRPGHETLDIGDDTITYLDADGQVEHTIAMPPTVIDWIRARLYL